MKCLAFTAAALAVAIGGFFYAAIATLCDEDYWPDW
jgi:hypothetical protein